MTNSDMIERVAKALLEHQIETGQCQPNIIPWSSFEGEARAAIEAMRENAPRCELCGAILPFDAANLQRGEK